MKFENSKCFRTGNPILNLCLLCAIENFQMSNCLFEALIQQTIKTCKCTPIALDFNLSTTSCYGKDIICKDNIFCKYRTRATINRARLITALVL